MCLQVIECTGVRRTDHRLEQLMENLAVYNLEHGERAVCITIYT